jgi:hypothetical protein
LVCPQCSGQYSDLELHIEEWDKTTNFLKTIFIFVMKV